MCQRLDIAPTIDEIHRALEFHDPLAVVFARLLLWTDPASIPTRHQEGEAWRYYLRTWRPGKPRPDTWLGHFGFACGLIDPAPSVPLRS